MGEKVEMVQDLADGGRVGDVGHHLERASAASADEGIGLKALAMSRDQLGEQRRLFGSSGSSPCRAASSSGRSPRTRLA